MCLSARTGSCRFSCRLRIDEIGAVLHGRCLYNATKLEVSRSVTLNTASRIIPATSLISPAHPPLSNAMFAKWMTTALTVLAASPLLATAAPAPVDPDNHLTKRAWPTIVNNCVNSGQVALTFDDGPYLYESNIGAALGGSKATFFLNGNSACSPTCRSLLDS
jgi:hypothetical protein